MTLNHHFVRSGRQGIKKHCIDMSPPLIREAFLLAIINKWYHMLQKMLQL